MSSLLITLIVLVVVFAGACRFIAAANALVCVCVLSGILFLPLRHFFYCACFLNAALVCSSVCYAVVVADVVVAAAAVAVVVLIVAVAVVFAVLDLVLVVAVAVAVALLIDHCLWLITFFIAYSYPSVLLLLLMLFLQVLVAGSCYLSIYQRTYLRANGKISQR
jgi:hypothetical protein